MNIMRQTNETRPFFDDVHTNWQAVVGRSGFTWVNSSGTQQDNRIEPNTSRHISQKTFDKYVHGAMKLATLAKMEDGNYMSEIPGFPGVWGSGDTLKDALDTLDEVLREWLLLKINDRDQDMPVIENINFNNI